MLTRNVHGCMSSYLLQKTADRKATVEIKSSKFGLHGT